jgi:Flp pilus assembly protein TadG
MFGVKVFAMLRAIRNFVVGVEGTAGTSLIEFALVAPLLIVIFTATAEFGLYLYRQMEVQNAAQAGAIYAAVCAATAPATVGSSCSYSSSSVSSAMTNATTLGVTPAYTAPTCYCPDSSGTLTQCTGTPPACTGSITPGYYVQVTATATFSPVTRALFLTKASYTLSASALVRVQ